MTRKRRRLWLVLLCGLGLGSAAALTLSAFRTDLVFFMLPGDVAAKAPPPGRIFRLGGLVLAGSVVKTESDGRPVVQFRVSDGHDQVPVVFHGILPDLFREGQGVVTLGSLAPDGRFQAEEVLAKHDSTYMPKDVAESLKARGLWNPASGQAPPVADLNGVGRRPAGAAGG